MLGITLEGNYGIHSSRIREGLLIHDMERPEPSLYVQLNNSKSWQHDPSQVFDSSRNESILTSRRF